MRRRPFLTCLLTLSCCAGAGMLQLGCLGTGEFTPIQYFTLSPEVTVPETQRVDTSLAIRPLDYARQYKQRMVYRENDYAIGYRQFESWAELPRDMISRELLDSLTRTGRFADVGYTYEMSRPDLILSGELRSLDEVRSMDTWTAECVIRFELRDRSTGEALWSDVVSASVEMEDRTAGSLARAMSAAVASVLEEAIGEIAEYGNRQDS